VGIVAWIGLLRHETETVLGIFGMLRFFSPNPVLQMPVLLLVVLLIGSPEAIASHPCASGGYPASSVSSGSGEPGGTGAEARYVSLTSLSAEIRLPIALVPGPVNQPSPADHGPETAASSLALPARKSLDAARHTEAGKPERALVTTATSLATVLGLFLLLVWFQRRVSGHRGSMLPGEVVQTLGRVPLNGRQEMHLVRVGNKLLLLAVTASSAETLTEITDAEEIERLSRTCRHEQPGSISASFREILNQLQQPASASR
jgi:flagellar biogenesis protein FliO